LGQGLSSEQQSLEAEEPVPPTLPSEPGNIQVSAPSATQTRISWTAASGGVGAIIYNVFRTTGPDQTSDPQSFSSGFALEYLDETVLPGTNYCYRVGAADGSTQTIARSLACVTTPSAPAAGTTLPSEPGNIQVSAPSATQTRISWTAASGGVGAIIYYVYRTTGPDQTSDPRGASGWQSFAAGFALEYLDETVLPGTNYCYRVGAAAGSGQTIARSLVCVTTPAATPDRDTSPPSVVTVTARAVSSSRIDLTWTQATDNVGVAGYIVAPVGIEQVLLSPNVTSYAHLNLRPATSYCYVVRAYDAEGGLSVSNQVCATTLAVTSAPTADTTAPSAPSNVLATAISSSRVDVSWTASSDNVGVAGYTITTGVGTAATAFYSTATNYFHTGRTAGTRYCYTIRAYDARGNTSAPSAEVCATTPSAAPVADTIAPTTPTNVQATAISASQINLTWTASTDDVGVTGYTVSQVSPSAISYVINTTSYSLTGLTAGTRYCYAVWAYDAARNGSPQSVQVCATTQTATPPPPPAPSSPTITSLGCSPTTVIVGQAVLCNPTVNAPTPNIWSYTWTNSETTTVIAGSTFAKLFSATGTKTITLKVCNGTNNCAQATQNITVR